MSDHHSMRLQLVGITIMLIALVWAIEGIDAKVRRLFWALNTANAIAGIQAAHLRAIADVLKDAEVEHVPADAPKKAAPATEGISTVPVESAPEAPVERAG